MSSDDSSAGRRISSNESNDASELAQSYAAANTESLEAFEDYEDGESLETLLAEAKDLDDAVEVDEFGDALESDDDESDDDEDEEIVVAPAGFEQFNLSEPVLKSLKKIGYTTPTEVQLRCLPILLEEKDGEGRDLVALARTGTGKTAAFGIPIIERIEASVRKPQALVLCPTRELCQQVATSLGQIGEGKRIRVLSIYGGDSYRRQFEGIQSGPHIIVATPGRLIDMLTRNALDLTTIRTLVLDEADEMISVGFREALDQILQSFASRDEDEAASHCTWLFSATMSSDIKRVQSRYIKNATMIDARGQEEKPLIRQQYMLTFEEDRLEALKRYLHVNENFYGLIFCQTKAEVAETESALKAEGFKVDSLHGDKVQRDRENVFAAWKKKTIKIVIATDVAARGLDVKGLTHVVNMSIPREDESYVHRIGRTGRAGQEGTALSFVWPKRMAILRQLERKLGVQMEHVQVPEPKEIARVVLGREIDALMSKPLEFDEDNSSHQILAELIQAKQPVDSSVLPQLAALAARILEKKNPALLNRPSVKVLRADERPQRGGGGGYERRERGGGGYERGGRGGYDRGGDRGGRGGYDRGPRRERSFDRSDRGGDRPEPRRFEPRGDGGAGPSASGFRRTRPEGGGFERREGGFAPRREGSGGGRFERREGGFDRSSRGPRAEYSYTRPSRDGDDSRTTADVAPRLRDRRGGFGQGGDSAPKRRGPWEKRDRN